MMKNNVMKMMIKASYLVMFALVVLSSCKKDDDPDPVLVEDGFYLKGEVTSFAALATNGMFVAGINEVDQAARTGMYEKYAALKAGVAGFNIVEKAGSVETVYGPATNDTVTLAGEDSQIFGLVQKGTLGTSGVFTVPADGLYHIVVDKITNTYAIIPVTKWAIIGGATPLGWSDNDMPLVGGFSQTAMTFQISGIELRTGDFKFRYSGGWKVNIAGDTVKTNSNFGGVLSGTLPNLTTTLVPGGSNISLAAANEGIFTVTLSWTPEGGFVSSLVKTADVTPLDYPENLFMIGDGVGDWDWANTDLPMIPVHSHPNAFWKIVWLKGTGAIKFAPAKVWAGDFGVADNSVTGIHDYLKGSNNLNVPAEAGYYMVYVDFEKDSISIASADVYLIGNTVGAWDAHAAANIFTIDNTNEVITVTKALVAGDLRMHAWHKWMTDWWQAEFMIYNNLIEFRGVGGDQAAVPLVAGNYKIDLNFKTGAGSITAQ
jgi:hypothetical protein